MKTFVLVDTKTGRGLTELREDPSLGPSPHPIVVDFLSPGLKHRTRGGVNSELLVKAVGRKFAERSETLIYDFTAGLGTDSFLLAAAGYRVVGFERDPRLHELLEDGLRRFHEGSPRSQPSHISPLQLEFRCQDATEAVARDLVKSDFLRPWAVVIDPMFEAEATDSKSLPKKEMALLRRMLPASSKDEICALFQAAASIATSRVIVKRPIGAQEIVEPSDWGRALKPRRLEGKTARFDIYSCRS